ncbi:MAG: SDR family NAD(P)-dependent oxidoreductase, partial [Terriglobia bacterium]
MASTAPVALVTGAARGIGRGIAVELARLGFSVAINDISDHAVAEECRTFCAQVAPHPVNTSFEFFQADIAQSADRARLLDAVRSRFGWIDLLV